MPSSVILAPFVLMLQSLFGYPKSWERTTYEGIAVTSIVNGDSILNPQILVQYIL